MTARRDALEVEGGEIPLAIAEPAGEAPLPFLVVVPSIFGIGKDLLEQMEELAEAGAAVAAMDPFWRVEAGALPYTDPPRAFERLRRLDLEASYGDFQALLGWCRRHPRSSGRVAALGICFGGPLCLRAAADGLLDGVVTWHGSRMDRELDRAAEMRCPMKHHVGGDDPVVPPATVDRLRRAFAGREDVEVVVHPSAAHGFSHRGAAAHQEAAERAGMDATRALLAELGG